MNTTNTLIQMTTGGCWVPLHNSHCTSLISLVVLSLELAYYHDPFCFISLVT